MSDSGQSQARTPVTVIRDAMPTSRHARMLFDMVVARLGDQAVVETADGGARLELYRREGPESDAIIPWPLLRMGLKGRLGTIVVLTAPPGESGEPPPRPGKAPKLRNLGPAEIEIHDGPHRITVTYGEDGRWIETTRSQADDAHAAVIAAMARGEAQPTESMAAYVEGIDLARHGSARVLRPAPLPGGVASVWCAGLYAVRDALFEERIPPDATCAVVDGFSGSALAWGSSLEEVLSAWREMVEREQPRPPVPDVPEEEPEPDFLERGEEAPGVYRAQVRISGPTPDVSWPEAVPANTPAVLALLDTCHHPSGDWGRWIRLLGPYGETTFALLRRTMDGCVIVGEHLAGIVDLAEVESILDGADGTSGLSEGPREDWPAHHPTLNSTTQTYCFVDEETHEPVEPRVTGVRQTHGFVTRELDGVRVQWQALRQRWLKA